jgi:hypothetical protein
MEGSGSGRPKNLQIRMVQKLTDLDGPKTYGSYGSGSKILAMIKIKLLMIILPEEWPLHSLAESSALPHL